MAKNEPQATEGEAQEASDTEDHVGIAIEQDSGAPITTGRKVQTPPWVADPGALAKIRKAAESVDLSVEDLANLVVESGVTALPPSDGITGTYTLKDLGLRLWGTMQDYPRHQRAEWFSKLTPTQQSAVIVTLRDRGFSSQVIAQDLGMKPLMVTRIWNKHADDLGAQVVGIRLNTIAGNLQIMAERAQHGSMQKKDFSSMWRIQKEFTQMLQTLGIVDRATQKVEITHNWEDRQDSELKALLELERKKETRQEQIKKIDATVVDQIPEELQGNED